MDQWSMIKLQFIHIHTGCTNKDDHNLEHTRLNSIQPPDTTTALSGWNVKHLGPEAVGIGGRKHVYRLERWETKNG